MPESLLVEFGKKLSTNDFSLVYSQPNSTQMVGKFQNVLDKMVEDTFPLKPITITSEDQPFFNEHLRALKRRRLREYTNHGKSEKYFELQTKFDHKFESELKKYKAKIELEVREGKRGSTYPALKKLGLRPGEVIRPGFQ